MDLPRWLAIYRSIADDFSFDPSADLLSSIILSNLVGKPELPDRKGSTAYVIGNGPNIDEAIQSISSGYTIVADSAISAYFAVRGCPDMIVTDLDGDVDTIFSCASKGTSIIIHAHGDNIHRIIGNGHRIRDDMIGTTQGIPYRNVANFFGFTDGDRSAYIASRMGFEKIVLVSFDFHHVNRSKPGNPAIKARKLKWAQAIISMLAEERGTALADGDFAEI
ncbi:conserved hypothetical protein [Thermoplasma acidophilum]|uniref:6-hydroxymethyl-7,8-dihydropterin pyrophosphokinase n=1 Tax=Thermoplasma acidophilum (strain ATCC 25905 / DSM 1728 / JCM 9062 / NBRC 15155 / AMRC-C165) TaxID=273075 RepID=Q9HIB0_THEAC|nr:6-hydroxymethylpterin diphosphokinase MptE-like protein [Thermoplasma acidophilum]CAC12551.1 conserved hypothetical protein [Thermoplasma acidophilum]